MDGSLGGQGRCPHCAERPAAERHSCPAQLEKTGCHCCESCVTGCADIARYLEGQSAVVNVDPITQELRATYLWFEEDEALTLPVLPEIPPEGEG